MVYDRLTPDGAAVALASYLARESAEGAPWLAIKPQWIPQPGSVLTGLTYLTELDKTSTAHKNTLYAIWGSPYGDSRHSPLVDR